MQTNGKMLFSTLISVVFIELISIDISKYSIKRYSVKTCDIPSKVLSIEPFLCRDKPSEKEMVAMLFLQT